MRNHTPENVSLDGRARATSNSTLPISLVQKYSSHTTAKLDDAKDKTIVGFHGEIRTVLVSCDWSFDSCFFQELVHFCWRANHLIGGVDVEHEVENNNHNDDRVRVIA